MTTPPRDTLLGTFAGNYQLIERIGEGGMGRIYRAVHPEIGRQAAVKVLFLHLAESADILRRFKLEAQAVTRIGHPSIIEVFDFGVLEDGRPFYIMEFLEGESLGQRLLRAGPMSGAEAFAVLDPVLDALHAAHQAKIVHRDLKPDNIFLCQTPRGRVVKLLDFGIVKLVDELDARTRTGALMGTPSYMSPEQAAGRTKEIGPASDIYSIGVILFQMLSGALPFQADSLGALLLEHINKEPPTLAQRNLPGVSAALSDLVAMCMAKEIAERPGSAERVREQLAALIGPRSTDAAHPPNAVGNTSLSATGEIGPGSKSSPAQAAAVRNRRLRLALATIGSTAVLTVVLAWMFFGSGNRHKSSGAESIDAGPAAATRTPADTVTPPPDVTTPPDARPRPIDAGSVPPDGRAPDIVERMEALQRLYEEGTITKAEFERQRQTLLDSL